jgi:hypothetical protein
LNIARCLVGALVLLTLQAEPADCQERWPMSQSVREGVTYAADRTGDILFLVTLKSLRHDQMAGVAGLAIKNGFDTPLLRQLAGHADGELGPRHEHLMAALRSAGVGLPRVEEAAAHLATF